MTRDTYINIYNRDLRGSRETTSDETGHNTGYSTTRSIRGGPRFRSTGGETVV